MQMGMGGTWLTPANVNFGDTCACNPDGWPSAYPIGDPSNGCCDAGRGSCAHLYQTLRAGRGTGSASCQRPPQVAGEQCGGLLSRPNEYAPLRLRRCDSTKACDTLGIVQISNRLVLPPDGLTLSKTGLLGVSYEDAARRHGGVRRPRVLDAAPRHRRLQGAGALRAQFFDTRPVGYEQQSAWLPDFGDGDVAANLGAPGYEWNTIKAYRASDGSYKIPKMVYPPSPIDPSRSVLITHPRKYSSADLHDPLDEWLTDRRLGGARRGVADGGRSDAPRATTRTSARRIGWTIPGRVRQRVGHAAHLRRGRRVRVVPQARRRAGGRRRARLLRQEWQRARRGRRAARARAAKLPAEDELRPVRWDWPSALRRLHREPGRRRRQPSTARGRAARRGSRTSGTSSSSSRRCSAPTSIPTRRRTCRGASRSCTGSSTPTVVPQRGSSRAAPRPRASRRSRARSSSRRRRGSRSDTFPSRCTRGSRSIKTASTRRRRALS